MGGETIIRPRGWQAVIEYVLPLLLLGFTGWSFFLPGEADAFTHLIFGVATAGSLVWLWHLVVRRARLAPDRLDYFNGFWERGIDRRDVKGTRDTGDERSDTFKVVPKAPECSPVKFPNWIIKHPEAAYWFDGLPDLDAVDTAAAEAALEADPAFGSAPVERRRHAKRLNVLTLVVTVATLVLCFVLAYGWTNRWAILVVMALPFVAVVFNLALPKVFRLANENGKSDPRPSLAGLLYVPGIFLPMATICSLHLIGSVSLLAWAVPCALVAIVYLAWRAPDVRKTTGGVLSLVFVPVAFFWAATAYADILFDTGPRQVFVVKVLDLRVSSGSKRSSYYVTLAPWGGATSPSEEDIYYRLYERLHVGDNACITLGRGMLGVAWYEIDACPPRTAGMQ